MKRSLAWVLFAICLSGLHTPVLAQNQNQSVLEEIIVTAQRREQSLQDVAISMTVLNQEQISDANMTNTSDLATYTPSLSTLNRFGSENASFSIRGFTKELRTTATVGVYFAEVVAPRGQVLQTSGDGAGPGTLFDLENVQVLKGPQGTLFGRNTTGGAILMAPKKPTEVFEGYVEVSAGSFDLSQQQAVISVPMTDWFKLRLGLDQKKREGHLDNITDIGADKLGDADYTAARLSSLIDFTDTIRNYTVVNYSDSESNGSTSRLFVCNTSDDPTDAPLRALRPGACERQLEMQRATGQDDYYDIVSTVPDARSEIEDFRLINKLTWDITQNITINNILGYTHFETINAQDLFGTQFTETQAALTGLGFSTIPADPNREFAVGYSIPIPGLPSTSQEAWVGEVQLQGQSFDGGLQWQAGVYYENSKPDGFSGNIAPSQLSCELSTIATGDPEQFNCFDGAAGAIGGVMVQVLTTEYTNKAVYSQATYALPFNFPVLDKLSITGGLRYTWDETEGFSKKARHRFVGTERQEPTTITQAPVQKSEAPTGLLELQYRPFPAIMVYTKYVRGYRQGGVNVAADPGVDIHDKETVDTYEIGAKTEFEWLIPGRFNVAVFDNDFRDMQLQTGYLSPNSGATTAIFNAGKAKIRGVEIDGSLQILEGLIFSFSFSRLDTELLEQDHAGNREEVEQAAGPIGGRTFTPTAVEGDSLPFAPERSYTASLDYRLPLPPSLGSVKLGATYALTGEQRVTSTGSSPNDILDEYAILNVNLGWKGIFGLPVDLKLFGTNIKDKKYATYISGTFNSLGFDSRMPGMPRMYGARLRYRF